MSNSGSLAARINMICADHDLFCVMRGMKSSSVDIYTIKRAVPWITYKAFGRPISWWLQETGAEAKCLMEPMLEH